MKVIITLWLVQFSEKCCMYKVCCWEPWTTKGFTISASVRIYKIQELLVHALLIVVEKYKKLLKKHHIKNHPSDPPPPKVAKKFKCEGCDKEEPSNWHYVRHISTCIHYKALQPRICGQPTQHLRSHGLQYYEESGEGKSNFTLWERPLLAAPWKSRFFAWLVWCPPAECCHKQERW